MTISASPAVSSCRSLSPASPGHHHGFKSGGKPLCLTLPVIYKRCRTYDQRLYFLECDKRKHLQSFSKPHIIRENTAKARKRPVCRATESHPPDICAGMPPHPPAHQNHCLYNPSFPGSFSESSYRGTHHWRPQYFESPHLHNRHGTAARFTVPCASAPVSNSRPSASSLSRLRPPPSSRTISPFFKR